MEIKTAQKRAWWSQRKCFVSTIRNWKSRPNEGHLEQYGCGVEDHSSKSHRRRILSRGAALTSLVPRSRTKKVLAGYGRCGGDAKMHPSHEQTGEEVGGLDGERP
jgi:hypothetical protein